MARASESGSSSTPTRLVSGNRVATAISHLPPPQWTSRTRPPPASPAARSGSADQAFLEEDGDVLGRERLDRPVVARRPEVHRPPGPGELDQALVIQAADHGRDELAAEVLGPLVIEQDRGDLLVDRRPVAVEIDQVDGVGQAQPGLDDLGLAAGLGGQPGRASGPTARRPGSAERARARGRGRSPRSGRTRARLAARSSKRSSIDMVPDCRTRSPRTEP